LDQSLSATNSTAAVGQRFFLQGHNMNTQSDRRPELQEDSKWGLIFILVMVLGIPLIGILAKLLAD